MPPAPTIFVSRRNRDHDLGDDVKKPLGLGRLADISDVMDGLFDTTLGEEPLLFADTIPTEMDDVWNLTPTLHPEGSG